MDKIEVSQRAREEAADLWIKVDGDFVTLAILQEAERYRRGDYDHTPAVQAFARFERDILATRTDATPVAVEMVAELQLSAFLAGRGSIRTKANGNTHESSPGPTMDDYRRMARFALAEGWVDATPVARKQFPILGSRGAKIDLQLVEDHGKQAYSNHSQTVTRLAERGGLSWCELHAVLNNRAWQKMDGNTAIAECRAIEARYLGAFNPPATDVAALVDAAKETNAALERDGDPAFAHLILANKAALAPFTKGQNDG